MGCAKPEKEGGPTIKENPCKVSWNCGENRRLKFVLRGDLEEKEGVIRGYGKFRRGTKKGGPSKLKSEIQDLGHQVEEAQAGELSLRETSLKRSKHI